jgi:hypothetical protein
MALSKEQYQEYVDRLSSRELKIKLSRTPTTMGPGYIADKIAEILDAKSAVNEMSEKVEMAMCEAEVQLNDLEEEIQLRTHLEYQNLETSGESFKNAKSRESYIWSQVEKGYVDDRTQALKPGDPVPSTFQLSEDLRQVKGRIIELKALQKMLGYRRDELIKLDSGVRLQQKTMETEAAIYGKGGMPKVSGNGHPVMVDAGVAAREPDELDDPAAMDEDFEEPPPPIGE